MTHAGDSPLGRHRGAQRGTALPIMFPEMSGYWLGIKDGDPRAFDMFSRHYSYKPYADNRRKPGYANRFLIVGPGEKLVLIGNDERALFCWRRFRDASGLDGVNCSVFRNESGQPGAALIEEAELFALRRWPDVAQFYTFVNPRQVQGTPPGSVFIRAGWECAGYTKVNKLLILVKPALRNAAIAARFL